MAKLIRQEEIEWHDCKHCPFFTYKYSGPDGFGMYETYDAPYCKKGHFGEVAYNHTGKAVYKICEIPKTIPYYCVFSDIKLTGKETLDEIVENLNISIQDLEHYIKDKRKKLEKVSKETLKQKEQQLPKTDTTYIPINRQMFDQFYTGAPSDYIDDVFNVLQNYEQ